MKQPVTTLWKLLLLALTLGTGYRSWGQTYTPVALTGFTEDIIANGTGAVSATTTADIDGAVVTGGTGYCLMAQDYVGPTGQVPNNTTYPALETSGLITSALNSAITFQLASYSAPNALRLYGATATGSLTFATPRSATELYVIGTSGNAAAVLDVTVNFAGGTSQTFASQTIADWFATSQTNVVREKLGRVSRNDNTVQYTGSPVGPRLYQLRLVLDAANVTKNITSITFSRSQTGTVSTGTAVLLAVTAGSTPVCATTPTNLSATATTTSGGTTALTSACSSTSVYLSVTGVSANTAGYTYQWQSSTTSATTGFTNISGATGSTYTATGQLATTYYRVVVACLYDGTGGTLVTSTAVQVSQNAFDACYCTPSSSSGCATYAQLLKVEITGTTLSNTSTCAASPYYTNYPTTSATAALSPGGSYPLSITVGRYAKAGLWIDYDHSGTFDANEYLVIGANATNTAGSTLTLTPTLTIPATALTGATRMRVRTQYNSTSASYPLDGTSACISTIYGEIEDYTITIATPVACTGTPPATTATSSATSVCASTGFTLSATGIAPGTTGLSYQWQSAPAGTTTFTNLGTAQTNSFYAVASLSASTDYRVIVTCTAAGQPVTSSVVSVAYSYLNCYCTPVSTGTGEYIKSVALPGTPGFTNASNANTAGYGDYTATAGLTTTLSQGASYVNGATFIVHSNNTNSQGGIWIDYDHSGTFDASEFVLMGTSSAINTDVTFQVTLTVPATALTGQTRVRVRWRNGTVVATDACTTGASVWYGETEDYFITIAAPTTCSAPPATVTATADVTNACANASFNLSTSSVPATLGGYTYQWQSRTGTNAFANISGATTNPYTVTSQTVATDYQLVVSCQFGGTPVTSNIVSVGQNSFNQCYCTASSTNVCSNYGVITSVALGSIVNASGCTSTNSYSDYTAISTNLAAGSTNTLTLGVASATTTYNYNYGVWIDFNQNGTFEASEFVASSTTPVSATSTAITIAIPALSSAVLSGPTRIRIRTNAGIASYGVFTATGANSACGAVYNGETEDYTVNIVTCTPSTATFSYGTAASYCTSGTTNPAVVLATGATAGTFTSTTGLTINATTGAITLSSSTPGTYTVTNTVAATGTQCASTATTTVTITAAPTAGFSYGSPATYCQSGATNPTVTLATGATAGTFSSTTGLTIAANGTITLSSSTPGTYTVTNTVAAANGCTAVTSTASITITAAPTAGFSYGSAPICIAAPGVTFFSTLSTGATAGTFTLPAGTTGLQITPSNGSIIFGTTATAGTYTVTNTVAASGGCAAVTSTATFTLVAPTTATFSYSGSPFCTSGTNPTPTITGTAGGTFSSTTGLTISATTGIITLGSSTAGTYTVTYTVAGPCGSSSTQSITITNAPTAGFSYATPGLGAACAGGTGTFAPTLATGATAGTFTASPAGLTINAATGVISLTGSTASTYTITNTVAASGGCAAVTSTTTFTVNPVPPTPILTATGTPATGITLTSSSGTGNQFYLNGNPIAGATGPSYLINSGTNNGAYTVVVTNSSGCSARSAATTVTVTATASAQPSASLTLYPNPTRDGQLTLELSGYREAVQVTIINALGQRVYESTIVGSALSQRQTLNLRELATGVYLLQARTASGSVEIRRFERE